MANELEFIINNRSLRGIDTTTNAEFFSVFIDQFKWKRDKAGVFSFYNSIEIVNSFGAENLNLLGVNQDPLTGEQSGSSAWYFNNVIDPDTGIKFVSSDIMATWLGTNTGFFFNPNPSVTSIAVSTDATLTGDGTVGDPLSVVPSGGGGGTSPTLRNISATDTFATTEETLNCTSGTFTVNLPTAVGIQGTTFTLVNSGTGVITLDGNGTETINGSLTIDIKRNKLSRTVQSDGSNWIII